MTFLPPEASDYPFLAETEALSKLEVNDRALLLLIETNFIISDYLLKTNFDTKKWTR